MLEMKNNRKKSEPRFALFLFQNSVHVKCALRMKMISEIFTSYRKSLCHIQTFQQAKLLLSYFSFVNVNK